MLDATQNKLHTTIASSNSVTDEGSSTCMAAKSIFSLYTNHILKARRGREGTNIHCVLHLSTSNHLINRSRVWLSAECALVILHLKVRLLRV